jgi:ABC-type uncharacterized transport system ATPase subunit
VKPEKTVTLTLSSDVSEIATSYVFERNGTREVIFRVPSEQAPAFVADALRTYPVRDISVSDPPLEEVMRDWFARGIG